MHSAIVMDLIFVFMKKTYTIKLYLKFAGQRLLIYYSLVLISLQVHCYCWGLWLKSELCLTQMYYVTMISDPSFILFSL
jgi:hypothetical protein